MRKLPNFYEKVTEFRQETYRPSEIPFFYLSVYLPIVRLESLTNHKSFVTTQHPQGMSSYLTVVRQQV